MRHYETATRKLYHEIDLLEIMRTLRMARFVIAMQLKNSQKELISF